MSERQEGINRGVLLGNSLDNELSGSQQINLGVVETTFHLERPRYIWNVKILFHIPH